MRRPCTTPGHEDRPSHGHGLCRSCWAAERRRTDPAWREKYNGYARARRARLRAERERIRAANIAAIEQNAMQWQRAFDEFAAQYADGGS